MLLPTIDEDDVRGTFTQNLIGDVSVRDTRESRLGILGHPKVRPGRGCLLRSRKVLVAALVCDDLSILLTSSVKGRSHQVPGQLRGRLEILQMHTRVET